jgi:hypothetical protein
MSEGSFAGAPAGAKVCFGNYAGNLTYPRTLNCGFTPDAVIILPRFYNPSYQLKATANFPAGYYSSYAASPDAQYDSAQIVTNGFTISVGARGTSNPSYCGLNDNRYSYDFIAIKAT